jgi:hypothetical protein
VFAVRFLFAVHRTSERLSYHAVRAAERIQFTDGYWAWRVEAYPDDPVLGRSRPVTRSTFPVR